VRLPDLAHPALTDALDEPVPAEHRAGADAAARGLSDSR